MAIRKVSIGSLTNWHVYDDSVSSYDITETGGSQVRLPGVQVNGKLDLLEAIQTRFIDADQITANTNDWDLETMFGAFYSNVRITSDAARDLTGILTSAIDGLMLRLTNVGSFNITLKHESASSTASYRFLNNGSLDVTLAPTDSVLYIYDTSNSRWRHTLSISSSFISGVSGAQYVTLATDGTLTNERVLTGTSKQVTVTDNGAGSTVVLSTPQDIDTDSDVQFNSVEIDGDLNHDGSNVGFFGTAPTTKQTALTSALTNITHTGPSTPDYAIATPIDSGAGSAWGFSTQDEFETIMSVVLNLQTRINELESKLQAYGLLS